MQDIIDVSSTCESQASFLAGAGVKTIFRYYSRDTGLPSKRLSPSEAKALTAAGLRLGIVHEAKFGNRVTSFSKDLGALDGAYARDYGTKTIGQPSDSAIYFAVDFDATAQEIRDSILPYFEGVRNAFRSPMGRNYRIGVYGSGAVCFAVLASRTADLAWLSQSTGWADFQVFLDNNQWSMRQYLPAKIGEVACDPNDRNFHHADIGDFLLVSDGNVASPSLKVIARDGLRMRSGPGIQFDVLRVLPNGTKLTAIKTEGDWTMVDLVGDQSADGFVSTHFLAPE